MDQRRAETANSCRSTGEGDEQRATARIGSSGIAATKERLPMRNKAIGGSVPSARNQLDSSFPSFKSPVELFRYWRLFQARRHQKALCKNDAERQEVREWTPTKARCFPLLHSPPSGLWHQPHHLENGGPSKRTDQRGPPDVLRCQFAQSSKRLVGSGGTPASFSPAMIPSTESKWMPSRKSLSELKPDEAFFSIDEYGPFAIKAKRRSEASSLLASSMPFRSGRNQRDGRSSLPLLSCRETR